MAILALGLVVFLGLHSTRIFAEGGRANAIARLGEGPWKAIYSLFALIGFFLIIRGFPQARHNVVELWMPPVWTRHITRPNALQCHPDGRLHLQEKPFRCRRASPDGLERCNVGGGAPPVERIERRRHAVRHVPRLGGCRPSQFLCARPAKRGYLSCPELGGDDRREPVGRRHLDFSGACTCSCLASRRLRLPESALANPGAKRCR